MVSEGWAFTDHPKARRRKVVEEAHKAKAAAKLAKSQYRMDNKLKKEAMKLEKSQYSMANKLKKEAVKLTVSEATERAKWAEQKASWGHKHPKR